MAVAVRAAHPIKSPIISQERFAILNIRVTPGARRDEIGGWHGNAIRVRCQAPALDGRANDAVLALLADRLGVRGADVRLIRGARSRDKVVRVDGLSLDAACARLGVELPR